jgi:hypothetical protein
VVCIDENGNGLCDASEPQGITDATGSVRFAAPTTDIGKFPILAIVGTNATDADHGPVTVPYTLSAPADQTAVVSPLTSLVEATVASTDGTSAAAQITIQNTIGVTASLFADYTTATAPTNGTVNPAVVARLLVVTAQQLDQAAAPALGASAADGTTITQASINTAIGFELVQIRLTCRPDWRDLRLGHVGLGARSFCEAGNGIRLLTQ